MYEWWQVCLITLSKGISWGIAIWLTFLAASWFMDNITKEVVEKVKKKIPTGE